MKKIIVAAVGICLLIGTALPAAEPSAEEKEAFRLYKEAQAMMELSQYDQAIEHLNKAWGIFRIPQIAIMKAKALQSKGDLTTALMVLKGIVSDDERIRTRVGAAIAELEAELAKPIEIDVTTSVDQVRMVIDKTSTFLIPGRITVTPGPHRIEYSAPGYRTKTEERSFSAADKTLEVLMEEAGGKIVLTTDLDSFFGVVVRIDGRELMPRGSSLTPNRTAPIEIAPGAHSFTCSKNGMPDYSGTFTLLSMESAEVHCKFSPVATTKKAGGPKAPMSVPKNPLAWTFFGIGTGMVIAGTALTGWYWDLKISNPDANFKDESYEGYWGPAMAGVGIAVAVMGFFIFKDKPKDARTAASTGPGKSFGFAVAPTRDGAAASFGMAF
ncbi:MAG TPA: hypothetical protein PKH54_05255 [Myxococcota bacterium]|nr:hypothetical protein [Myxococcota bacterium]HOC99330.1 hypothetical protein [Myxococcota bacterium]HOH76169.1 hypothetical protein [Myxococcota bacterium]